MRAAQVVETTGPAGVRLVDIAVPALPPGGVLVDVAAAGLSFPDVLLARGRYQMKPPLPFTLGVEAAGTVREAASESGFRPGERVTAFGLGGCAEVMAAIAPTVCRTPPQLSDAEAAGLTMNYHTAHFALVRRGRLRAGEWVLVQGAAGGVGTAVIQVAAAKGARVIGVVSTEEKAEVARRAGAHEVVRSDGDWRAAVMELTGGRGVDLAVDPVGGERLRETMRCLGLEGRLVVVGFAEGSIPEVGANRILFRNIDIVGAAWGAFVTVVPELVREVEADLAALAAAGAVRPLVSEVLPLDEVARGLTTIEERRVLGKVVVQVA